MSSEEARKVMATWVAAIANNVKNPIAGISAVLDLAEARLHDPIAVGSSISQIRTRLEELNEYVSELADFARAASVQPVPTALRKVIEQAVEEAHLPSACEVTIDIAAEVMVSADATKLKRVVKALLRNAVEAVEAARTPIVCVGASVLASGAVVLTVEDNGVGLAPDIAQRALEPFFSTKEAGTGLGLAVARKYIEAHGGAIAFDSSPALGGCRVTLSIPSPLPGKYVSHP